METEKEQQKYRILENLYEQSEARIKTAAIVKRAYIDKISQNLINEKVNAQLNSVKAGIHDINPKFKEGSKNYDITKKMVSETMANYKRALEEYSEFFDGKIEQLILRKVELQASLVGAIINEDYLEKTLTRRSNQKENDGAKKSFKDNIKLALEQVKYMKKNDMQIDPIAISKILDQQDVVEKLDQDLSDNLEKTILDKKNNESDIEKIEKEIFMIDGEIERINERKKNSIYEAMEVGSRVMTINIRRPKMFKKITRFFASRFNASKIVETAIIAPLNIRIENFKNNELATMKG